MTVRGGVICCGWWATRAHLPALAVDPDAVVVAIADPDDANRSRAAEHSGVTRAFASAGEMLDAESLDATVVAIPHAAHAPLARLCLERGLHVLLEKPMTIEHADAWALVDLARVVSFVDAMDRSARAGHAVTRAGQRLEEVAGEYVPGSAAFPRS